MNTFNTPALTIKENTSRSYAPRTWHNALAAGLTVAFAIDFTSPGEKLTKKAAISAGEKRYVAIRLDTKVEEAAKILLCALERSGAHTLNVAGNSLYTLRGQGWTQENLNSYIHHILSQVVTQYELEHIVSGGQNGADIAGIVAATALGIKATATLPNGFIQRDMNGDDSEHTEAEIRHQVLSWVELLPAITGNMQ